MTVVTALSYWTGLAFVAPPLAPSTVVGTGLALHVCHAILCRLIAHNNGHAKNRWTVLGFLGGVWAVTLLLLRPRRADPKQPSRPLP